jgi:hypothetical protein
MSQLNVNNTDELFKRASEEYPLRTDSADWDRLAAALEKDPSLILPPLHEDEGGRKKRRFFWLFFLLPLGGLGYYAWTRTARHEPRIEAIRSQPAAQPAAGEHTPGTVQSAGKPEDASPATTAGATAAEAKTAGTTTTGATTPGATATNAGKPRNAGSTIPATTGKSANANSGKPATGPTVTTSAGTQGATPAGHISGSGDLGKNGKTDRTTISNIPADRTTADRVTTDRTSDETAGQPRGAGIGQRGLVSGRQHKGLNDKGDGTASNGSGGVGGITGPMDLRNNPASNGQTVWAEAGYSPLKAQRARTGEGVLLDIPVHANSAVTTSAKDNGLQKPEAAKARQKNKSEHSFYAGIMVAPDLSTVKFQSVKGMGITTGVLFGYNLNARWAIETGLYLDVKKYYTEGQYFDKKKVQALWNVDIKTVDGSCNMFEIPLNLRYNLSTSEKRKWFATGGLTSYLMYQEKYAYELASAGYSWPKSATYHNPSQSWFSQISLSMGYEEKLGKIGNLRLEPYLRIPLAGIGTGSLPITSAGLNIGLTHKFR